MKRFVIVSAVTFLSLPVISTVLLRTTHSGVVMAANASGTNDEGHGHRFRSGLRAETETVKLGDTFIEGRRKWESLDENGGSIARSLSGTRWTG
jgi:hypothetical protein